MSKHPHRREEGWTAVAASGAQKPLAEVKCLSDDPFLLASCVKFNLQHLPLVAMSFHISLLLEYVQSVSKLTCSFCYSTGREGSKNKPLPFPSNLVCLVLRLTAACSLLLSLMAVRARSEAALGLCLPLPPTLRKQAPTVVCMYYSSWFCITIKPHPCHYLLREAFWRELILERFHRLATGCWVTPRCCAWLALHQQADFGWADVC